jgi:hypothetical protein
VCTIAETVYGWGSLHTLGLGAVALVLIAGFVADQASALTPLMALRVLRSRNVSGGNLIGVLMVGGLFGTFFLGALYLQRALGYSPVEVGLAFLPVALLIALFSLNVSDRLILRFGARPTLLAGLAFVLAGLLAFARVPADGHYLVGRPAHHDRVRHRRRAQLPGDDVARDVGATLSTAKSRRLRPAELGALSGRRPASRA